MSVVWVVWTCIVFDGGMLFAWEIWSVLYIDAGAVDGTAVNNNDSPEKTDVAAAHAAASAQMQNSAPPANSFETAVSPPKGASDGKNMIPSQY